jgi:transglutaminase-like putative cysteine protease
MKRCVLLCWLALTCSSGIAGEQPTLDPNAAYQAVRANPVTYEVDFSVVVTPPYKAKVLKVWLPLPQSDFGQEVTEGDLTTFPLKVQPSIAQEEVFGNKFAFFAFGEPQGAQIVRHRFKVKVWELRWNLQPDRAISVTQWPASFDRYRQGESQSVVVNDRFEALLAQIIPRRGDPLHDMSTVITWVNKNFQYDHADASLQASSVHGLEKRHGHCSDYHGFCAAMGRVMGYPTRVTYGINAFPKNSPSHCKLEVFLPPYGWVSFDVSETQNLVAAIHKDTQMDSTRKDHLTKAAQDRLFTGFRDNTWFLQTRGTDYQLAPPASKRVPVVRTIYAEADGVPLPEPDPANKSQRGFAWMTVHQYTPDRPVTYPFKDLSTLERGSAGADARSK